MSLKLLRPGLGGVTSALPEKRALKPLSLQNPSLFLNIDRFLEILARDNQSIVGSDYRAERPIVVKPYL